jgi:hypothetical protein
MSDLEKMWEEDSNPEINSELKNDSLKEVSFWAQEQIRLTEEVSVEEEAFAWLKANGHEDIIKNVVSLQFGRGEDESAETMLQSLTSQGYSPSNKRWVEPMTLKAFAREQVESGTDLPFETFNVYVGQKTKITKG